ncbi:MAG: four helix bundle protein [Clostridia bacterium]|nr:four helix bundle protein [Clostridia bacterium]
MDKKVNNVRDMALQLTVEITEVCDSIKGRGVYTNQLMRACSSIGANAYEAKYAQSNADFISKLEISLKECYETEYWLEVLFKIGDLSENIYKKLLNECGTIRFKLIKSLKTVKGK